MNNAVEQSIMPWPEEQCHGIPLHGKKCPGTMCNAATNAMAWFQHDKPTTPQHKAVLLQHKEQHQAVMAMAMPWKQQWQWQWQHQAITATQADFKKIFLNRIFFFFHLLPLFPPLQRVSSELAPVKPFLGWCTIATLDEAGWFFRSIFCELEFQIIGKCFFTQ